MGCLLLKAEIIFLLTLWPDNGLRLDRKESTLGVEGLMYYEIVVCFSLDLYINRWRGCTGDLTVQFSLHKRKVKQEYYTGGVCEGSVSVDASGSL